jgi:hypothetical protein
MMGLTQQLGFTLATITTLALGQPLPDHLQRLRSFADLEPPTSLADAVALHTEAKRRAARIQQHYGHHRAVLPPLPTSSRPQSAPVVGAPIIRPTDFGADPTGATDSSPMMAKALAALLAARGGPRHTMASNITDLGGATLDLSGGTYLISAPLVIPPGYGNAQIVRGTLRATSRFPGARWLVEIGSTTCAPRLPSGKPDGQGSCNEFINLSEMMFDASHVAAGGVKVSKVMGTTVGPSVFFTGFNLIGLQINAGHEVMLSEAWLAECYWSDTAPCAKKAAAGAGSIAVEINGNDHYLTDVIVFDYAHIGVSVNGAANILQAVHTWNGGGVGMRVAAHQTRLVACYLDYNKLVVVDPSQLAVTDTFFLETHANFTSKAVRTLKGVEFSGNTYATEGASIIIDPKFIDATDTVIDNEINGGCTLKLTRSKQTVAHPLVPTATFEFDFDESLLLPTIEQVLYSFTASPNFTPSKTGTWGPGSSYAQTKGKTVTVHFERPVTGKVTLSVDQSRP